MAEGLSFTPDGDRSWTLHQPEEPKVDVLFDLKRLAHEDADRLQEEFADSDDIPEFVAEAILQDEAAARI